jgi:predicted MFS family arabinose efflux permease
MKPKRVEQAETRDEHHSAVNRFCLVLLLAFAAGATVASIYYSQPLLESIAKHFHSSYSSTSIVSVATQLGYASGLLLILPMGDSFERRALIVTSTVGTSLTLLAAALSPTLPVLIFMSYILGLICMTPQLVVAYSAGIAAPESRGRTVGTVMSGLLIGILFSRSVSGFVGARAGWQAVYFLAAGTMLLLALLLAFTLPTQRPERRIPYRKLLESLWPILRQEPVLQRHAMIGALGFGAFSAFWTTLSFYLANRPEHFDSQVTGFFGLVGVAGAMVAPISGRLSDRFEARIVNGAALAVIVVSFIVMRIADYSLLWLVIGVFLMDAGVQGSHISNQTRIYALSSNLRNRINAVYMICYFLGGALGSAIGSWAFEEWQWTGVCFTGAGLGAAGLVVLFSNFEFRPGSWRKEACADD